MIGTRSPIGQTAVAVAALALSCSAAAAQSALPPELAKVHDASVSVGECQPLDYMSQWYSVTTATLSDTETLYIVPCQTGVVNPGVKLYAYNPNPEPSPLNEAVPVRTLNFAQFRSGYGWVGQRVLLNAKYDEATHTLTAFEAFSVIGDCGESGTWTWRDGDFALTEYHFQDECDGTHAFRHWPVIWQEPSQ